MTKGIVIQKENAPKQVDTSLYHHRVGNILSLCVSEQKSSVDNEEASTKSVTNRNTVYTWTCIMEYCLDILPLTNV